MTTPKTVGSDPVCPHCGSQWKTAAEALKKAQDELARVKDLARQYLAALDTVVSAATKDVCDIEQAERWMDYRERFLREAVAPIGGAAKDLSHYYCGETPCAECAAEKTPNTELCGLPQAAGPNERRVSRRLREDATNEDDAAGRPV